MTWGLRPSEPARLLSGAHVALALRRRSHSRRAAAEHQPAVSAFSSWRSALRVILQWRWREWS
jgi:hypothetical protein